MTAGTRNERIVGAAVGGRAARALLPTAQPVYAPRWTFSSVAVAALLTVGIFLLLPYAELVTQHRAPSTTLRTLDTAAPVPVPPPAEPTAPRVPERRAALELPKLALPPEIRPPLALNASLKLDTAFGQLGGVGGDFDVAFAVRGATLAPEAVDRIFELGELDEPPDPIVRPQPAYPPRARMLGREGVVVVEFVVDTDGRPRDVASVSAPEDDGFSVAAVRAVEHWRFRPGMRDGRAVPVRVRQKIWFRLE